MDIKVCPHCETVNPISSWNCSNCGETLSVKTIVKDGPPHRTEFDSKETIKPGIVASKKNGPEQPDAVSKDQSKTQSQEIDYELALKNFQGDIRIWSIGFLLYGVFITIYSFYLYIAGRFSFIQLLSNGPEIIFYVIVAGISLKFPHRSALSIFGIILAWKSFEPIVKIFKGQFTFNYLSGTVTLITIILVFVAFRSHTGYKNLFSAMDKNLLSGPVLHQDKWSGNLFSQISIWLGLAAAVSIIGAFVFIGVNTLVNEYFKSNQDVLGLVFVIVEHAALLGFTFSLISFDFKSQNDENLDLGLKLNGFVLIVLGYLIFYF